MTLIVRAPKDPCLGSVSAKLHQPFFAVGLLKILVPVDIKEKTMSRYRLIKGLSNTIRSLCNIFYRTAHLPLLITGG